MIYNDTKEVGKLTPRDVLFLQNLSGHGLRIIEIRISPISGAVGCKISDVSLPIGASIINVIQKGKRFFPADNIRIQSGDTVYILTDHNNESSIRELLTTAKYPTNTGI